MLKHQKSQMHFMRAMVRLSTLKKDMEFESSKFVAKKLSKKNESIYPFLDKFNKKVAEMGLTKDNICITLMNHYNSGSCYLIKLL